MKKYAVLHEPGDIVTLAGTRFVVLDVERRGSLPDSLFLLALESVGASEFGSSNNYAESDLKKAVDNGWRTWARGVSTTPSSSPARST